MMPAKAARNAEILRLLGRGMTFDAVALRLGLSRSAVAGIAFRARGPAPPRRKKGDDAAPNPEDFLPPRVGLDPFPDDPKICRWLGGKVGRGESCDAQRLPGKSWCAAHYARVFVVRKKKGKTA